MSRQYDLAIIGSGPGGYAAALAARRKGLRVALIEREQWGGVCLNVGCIPTKALIAVAQTMRRIQQAARLGIRVEGATLDYPTVLARTHRIITQLRQGLTRLLRHHKVELISGEAAFEDPHTLRITHEHETFALSAHAFIIATGARPSAGPWAFDGNRLLSYRDLLALPSLPSSLLILGGGVIGCEFASCLSSFGVQVTIVEQEPAVLPMEDPEAVGVLAQRLQARGVTLLTQTTVQSMSPTPEGVRVTLSDAPALSGRAEEVHGSQKGGAGQGLSVERCLIAIGQHPNSQGLGLEPLGIRTGDGVGVNEFLLTSHPHLAAIGDCLAGHGLAHLASAEGVLAVHNLFETPPASLDYHAVPRCIFTDPELAQVGVLEREAPDTMRVSRFSFAALGKSLCDEEPEGFVKLLVDPATDKVLGATIVGAQASSLIHLACLAIQHGLTARQLARSITAHPTLPEAFSEAAAQIYGEALYSAVGSRLKGGGFVQPRASSLEP